jgi:hypothetical protein
VLGQDVATWFWPQEVEASSDEIRRHWPPWRGRRLVHDPVSLLALMDNLSPLVRRRAMGLLGTSTTRVCPAAVRHESVGLLTLSWGRGPRVGGAQLCHRHFALAMGYLGIGGCWGNACQATRGRPPPLEGRGAEQHPFW